MEQGKHYYAFISHSTKDEKIALWLCNKLDNYHIPATVQKEYGVPKNLKPNFTFQTNLAGNKLRKALGNELDDSQYLIVVCSPDAAHSNYVNDEVQHFIDTGRTDRIIPFIIEGTPEDCFPPALLSLKGEEELRGVNLKETEKHLGSKMAAVVNVVATMLGVRFDVLWDKYRRRRIRQIIIFTVFVLLIAFLGVLLYGFNRTKSTLYLDYIEGKYIPNEQTEWFDGLFELSEADAKKEIESYRFEYKRIPIGQPQFGRWQLTKVIHVNSSGYPSKIENQTSPFVRYPISEIKYQYIDNVYRPERIECFDENGVLQRIIHISGENLENVEYKDNRTNLGYNKQSMSQFYNPLFEHLGNKYCNITHLDINRDSLGYIQNVVFKSSNSKSDHPFVDSRGSCGMFFLRDSLGRIESVLYLTPSVIINSKMAGKYFENRAYKGKKLSEIFVGNYRFDKYGKYLGDVQWLYCTSFRYNDTTRCVRTFRYQDSTRFFDNEIIERIANGRIIKKDSYNYRFIDSNRYVRNCDYSKQFAYNKNGTIRCIYSLEPITGKEKLTQYSFNSKRLPIREIHKGLTDSHDNYVINYEYDDYNRIREASYCGLNNTIIYQIRYTYDKYGRISAESYYNDKGVLSDYCTFGTTTPTDDFEKHFLEWVSCVDNDTLWNCGIAYPVCEKYAKRTFQYDDYGNVDAIRYFRRNDSCIFMINENIQDNGLVRRSVVYAINLKNNPDKQYLIVCNSSFGDDVEFVFELLQGMPLDSMRPKETIVPDTKSEKNEKEEITKFDPAKVTPCEGKSGHWMGNSVIREDGRVIRSDYVYVNY